jgi:O-antigen ligase
MRTRVAKGYALILVAVWLVYGAYSLLKGSGHALMIFLFSLSCAAVMCGMFFFSAWMMRRYERIDRNFQETLQQEAHQVRQKKRVSTSRK